jgi:hypothetical protein
MNRSLVSAARGRRRLRRSALPASHHAEFLDGSVPGRGNFDLTRRTLRYARGGWAMLDQPCLAAGLMGAG